MKKKCEIEEGTKISVYRLKRKCRFFICAGRDWVSAGEFFLALPALFPDAEVLYFEGTSMSQEVVAVLERHVEPGMYVPHRGTLKTEPQLFRCKFSQPLLFELIALCETNAEPEICDHLHIFGKSGLLLSWYDAFWDQLVLSANLDEESRGLIAETLRMEMNPVPETVIV